jgi:hypothetical protein
MSIDMEHFGSTEHRDLSYATNKLVPGAYPYRLQCRACGFEPEEAIVAPPRCPKCASSSWERFAYPRSLLGGFGRRMYERPDRVSHLEQPLDQ